MCAGRCFLWMSLWVGLELGRVKSVVGVCRQGGMDGCWREVGDVSITLVEYGWWICPKKKYRTKKKRKGTEKKDRNWWANESGGVVQQRRQTVMQSVMGELIFKSQEYDFKAFIGKELIFSDF